MVRINGLELELGGQRRMPREGLLLEGFGHGVGIPIFCVICTLFFSSTLFSESISLSKYPEKYAMYQERVAMFVPILTPVWGALTSISGKKDVLNEALWGNGKGKGKAE